MSAYKKYLQSEEWRAKREWALERAEHRCQTCGTTSKLDVHHRDYRRLGAEKPADLIVLCRGCHDLFHEAKKAKARAEATAAPPIPGITRPTPKRGDWQAADAAICRYLIRLPSEKRTEAIEMVLRDGQPHTFDHPWREIFDVLTDDPEFDGGTKYWSLFEHVKDGLPLTRFAFLDAINESAGGERWPAGRSWGDE